MGCEKHDETMGKLLDLVNGMKIEQAKFMGKAENAIGNIEKNVEKNTEILNKLNYEINDEEGKLPKKLKIFGLDIKGLKVDLGAFKKYTIFFFTLTWGVILFILRIALAL